MLPISTVSRTTVTSSLHWITLGVIVTVTCVLTPRPIAAIGTGDLTLDPGPAPGTDTLPSHVVTRALVAVAGVLALRSPGSLRARIHTVVSSEARSAATPSRYGVTP